MCNYPTKLRQPFAARKTVIGLLTTSFQESQTPCRRTLVCLNPGSFFTPTHFLHRVHMNPVNPIDSAVVHPPRLLVALWCYRQLKKTGKKTGACYESNI